MAKLSTQKKLMIGGSLVLFLAVSYYVYVTYAVPILNKQKQANLEHTMSDGIIGSNTAEVMFFFADWCPHCKKAKPEWNKLKQSSLVGSGKVVNGYTIVYTEVDCTDDKNSAVQEKLNKFRVEGFPTIKLIKGTEVIEYDAKPDEDTLTQFLTTALS